MSLHRPPSNERPGDQSSKTPSGKKIPMAMSMMVDSMVRMIQQGSNSDDNNENEKSITHNVDEN